IFQRLINSSLTLGHVPVIFKQAVVQPLLKRPGLDASLLSNFRPISKLPFVSKILEKEVCSQLQTFLESQNIFEVFQSGFKTLHSTETALLRVFNDILLTADSGKSVLLVLLDLTAAFDTVDHNILIYRLEHHVGIRGTALEWFKSYLSDRSFSVSLGKFHSSSAPLPCGVPQGSILGPLLFSIYLLPLGHIIKKHKVSFHFYADDCQIYLPLKHNDLNPLRPILECLKDIRAWLALNFLNFNEKKTEVIIFGPNGPGVPPSDLGPLTSCVKSIVTNLGVKFDTALKMDKQVNTVVRKSFFQLSQLSKVKPFISFCDLERVLHAFVTTRLDYCNGLYIGIDQASLSRLQMVQNAAARLLTGTRKHEHITPVLASLHWLPVHFRIHFKILLLAFKVLNGLAPSYLSDLLHQYTPQRSLRSSDQSLLAVPMSRLKHRGDRAFAVVAPKLWNNCPSILGWPQHLKCLNHF
uniref:Reverse transcriptase domain-containing protein n=1 Tax=Oreochromis niloticus TaxID=8128 RepID=A0A669DV26_ORENI